MAEIKPQATLGEDLQAVRAKITKMELKKSGYNQYGKFKYFQLEDFLPQATALLEEKHICPVFQIAMGPGNVEMAVLTLTRGPEEIEFKVPTAEPNNSSNPIQNLGSKITYLRRYLYMICLDLCEYDTVDAVAGSSEDKKINYATKFQIDKIIQNKEKLMDKLKEMNIRTANDIKALTTDQASEILETLKDD